MTGIITHYGLFWTVSDVLWSGWRGTPSQLLGRERTPMEQRGRPPAQRAKPPIDYSEYAGVYCLYRGDRLIYVGEAGLENDSTLFKRLKAHHSDHLAGRWNEFSWFGCNKTHLANAKIRASAGLAQAEAILIAVTNPGFNKQSGTFKDAIQVFQEPHDDADGDVETNLWRIMDELDEIKLRLPPPAPKKRGRPRKSSS